MRAIGFNIGQLGDLVINTVAARAYKEVEPEAHLTMGIAKKYKDIAPLFYQHGFFDNFHIYENYDGWPGSDDLDYLRAAKYDTVFNGMPQHTSNQWWTHYNQTEEACAMHGIPIPLNIQCNLNPWFHRKSQETKNYVAFNYIGGFYAGYPNTKSYDPARAKAIVDHVNKLGYNVIHLGNPAEPALEGTEFKPLTLLETVEVMLNCKMLIGVDSFLTWAASAYNFPVLACYSHRYYGGDYVKNIQAPNPYATYLDSENLNDIPLDLLCSKLDNLLR